MAETTGIEWTGATWNPWIGCHHVSPGCDHCYAETLVTKRMGQDFRRLRVTKTFYDPVKWARHGKTGFVFTCSLSDFFHAHADKWRPEAWSIIRATPGLTYQILTKRPERIPGNLPADWNGGYPNVWLGTSVERREYGYRVARLLDVPARLHFLSCEPLLGPVGWDPPEEPDWIIVGGESGPGCRPMDPAWARQVRDYCVQRGIPFFLKQLGGHPDKRDHEAALLDGRLWKEMPRQ